MANLFHALAKVPDINAVPYKLVDKMARMLLPCLPDLEPWQFCMCLYACGKLRYRNELFIHAVIEHALSDRFQAAVQPKVITIILYSCANLGMYEENLLKGMISHILEKQWMRDNLTPQVRGCGL